MIIIFYQWEKIQYDMRYERGEEVIVVRALKSTYIFIGKGSTMGGSVKELCRGLEPKRKLPAGR